MQPIHGRRAILLRQWPRRLNVIVCFGVAALAMGCQNDSASDHGQRIVERSDVASEQGVTSEPGITSEPDITPLGRISPQRPARPDVPKVLLSEAHAELCTVTTDDRMPPITLPDIHGDVTQLSSLYGERLTVVCFWKGDRAFARSELNDLGPDVAEKFADEGVNVVGIAVEETPESAVQQTKQAGANFPTLVDSDGEAFSQVGTAKLPRTYLLDAEGNILWFDIEYSRSTRRDLHTAIRAALDKS